MPPLETEVLATPEAIAELTDRVLAFLKEEQVEARATHHVALIVEELVTNLGTHGNCDEKPARIKLMVEPTQVKGEILDTGPPFDPRTAPDPDVEASVNDRPIGGLGLYLIRKLSCRLEYSHQNGQNLTTFTIARS
jgi:serine/threonine-protein kinase RsbW